MNIRVFIQEIRKKLSGDKEESPPQLVMWYRSATPPDLGPFAEEYQLRTYREGDEDGWMELLNANGQLGKWDREKIRSELDGALVKEAQYFVVCGEQIVATAGVYGRPWNGSDAWEIGWVAAHPDHLGKNLGGQVTAAAVTAALEQPSRPIFLRTDDFRIPALKVYLHLGFVPDYQHSSYEGRWREIFAVLGEKYDCYRTTP